MVDQQGKHTGKPKRAEHRGDSFPAEVGLREQRKLRARAKGVQDVWFGLGTFGVVGWSVAVPLVLGIFLGLWIDRTWPSRYSWTLMLLLAGLLCGLVNAWLWVERQRTRIQKEREK